MAVKPKMRECKLRSVVHFQAALKQKGIKETVIKQDPRWLAVFLNLCETAVR